MGEHRRFMTQRATDNRNKSSIRGFTFPEPRNPVMMVAGMRSSGGIFVRTSEPSSVAVADATNRREHAPDLRETVSRPSPIPAVRLATMV